MTDKEKLEYLIGFIEGTIGGNSFIASLDVKAAKEAIKKVKGD